VQVYSDDASAPQKFEHVAAKYAASFHQESVMLTVNTDVAFCMLGNATKVSDCSALTDLQPLHRMVLRRHQGDLEAGHSWEHSKEEEGSVS